MKRILTNKEYRFIKGLKELMIKYNAVISTDAQGKIEIVVNEDNESFDFEANGICRVHDSIYASDENDILIGRKMKSVIDKLF